MAGWTNLSTGIKPIINNVVAEIQRFIAGLSLLNSMARQAPIITHGYRVIEKAQVYNSNVVYVYVLNGIKLEAVMRF